MKKIILSSCFFAFSFLAHCGQNDSTPSLKKICHRQEILSEEESFLEKEHLSNSDEEGECARKTLLIDQEEPEKCLLFTVHKPLKKSVSSGSAFFIAPTTFASEDYQNPSLTCWNPQQAGQYTTPERPQKVFSINPDVKIFRSPFSFQASPKKQPIVTLPDSCEKTFTTESQLKETIGAASFLAREEEEEEMLKLCSELERAGSLPRAIDLSSATPSQSIFEERTGSRNSSMDQEAINKHFAHYQPSPVNFSKRNAEGEKEESRFANSTPVSFDPEVSADKRPYNAARRSTPAVLAAAAVARAQWQVHRSQSVPPMVTDEPELESPSHHKKPKKR